MKKYLQNAALFTAALAFAVLLCEGMFYFLNKAAPAPEQIATIDTTPSGERLDFFQYHPVYGFTGVPNIRKQFAGKFISHNSRGQRGPEIPFNKPDRTKRLVFIGDSQTWGWGVSDHETISHYTNELLNHMASPYAYEAVNLGASGFGTDQSYLRLLTEGMRYQPDYVVYTFFTANDAWEAARTRAWGVEKPYVYERQPGEFCASNIPPRRSTGWPSDNLSSIVENKLDIKTTRFDFAGVEFDLAETQTATYFKNRSLSLSLLTTWGEDRDPFIALKEQLPCVESEPGPMLASEAEQLAQAVKIIYQMRAAVEAKGGKLIVAMTPRVGDYDDYSRGADYRFVTAKMHEAEIPVIDVQALGHSRRLSASQLFIDFGHLSAAGNKMVAESLVSVIAAEGITKAQ